MKEESKTEASPKPVRAEFTPRWVLLAVAAVGLIAVGIIGLTSPVHLSEYDAYGFQISCGTGLSSDTTQARSDGGATDARLDNCGGAVLLRRVWTTAAILGGITVLVASTGRGVRRPHRD